MILLCLFFTFIENITMSVTVMKSFHIQSKLKILSIMFISTFYMTLIKTSTIPNFFISLFPIFGYTLFLTFEYKDFHFSYFAFPAILIFLLLFSNSIGYISASYILKIPDVNSIPNYEFIYNYSLISCLLFILLCMGFYYITHKNRDDIKIKDSIALGTAMFLLIMMFSTLLESVILTNFNIYTIYTLMIEFIILSLLIFYLYSNMHKQTKENIIINNELLKIQYKNQMYSIVNQLNDQLTHDKHMMIYNLLKIKHMLNNNNEEIQQFIDKEIERMSKYKYISSTGNILFDYTMTNKINMLISNNIDVKAVFMLNKDNELLDDETLVDFFIHCIDIAIENETKIIQIFTEEKNNYIIFKIITTNTINIQKIKKHPKIKKINYKSEDNYKEISLLIK